MAKRRTSAKAVNENVVVPSFHERFSIPLSDVTERERFVARSLNYVGRVFLSKIDFQTRHSTILWQVANGLGMTWESFHEWKHYVGYDYYKHLRSIEIIYKALSSVALKKELTSLVWLIIGETEIDLGIEWNDGHFVKAGAKLLDSSLVNDPLRWLAQPRYQSVRVPFEKGLRHFLEGEQTPDRLADAITDVYEALEALAKVVTNRPTKDLSANAELFLKSIGVSAEYKLILKDLITYANTFRHAVSPGQSRPTPSGTEVESYIYLCGLLIRVAIQATTIEIPATGDN